MIARGAERRTCINDLFFHECKQWLQRRHTAGGRQRRFSVVPGTFVIPVPTARYNKQLFRTRTHQFYVWRMAHPFTLCSNLATETCCLANDNAMLMAVLVHLRSTAQLGGPGITVSPVPPWRNGSATQQKQRTVCLHLRRAWYAHVAVRRFDGRYVPNRRSIIVRMPQRAGRNRKRASVRRCSRLFGGSWPQWIGITRAAARSGGAARQNGNDLPSLYTSGMVQPAQHGRACLRGEKAKR